MRILDSHKGGDMLNDELTIEAIDEPSEGGAPHMYSIKGGGTHQALHFHKGPLAEVGEVNGVSIESLLAICEDRLLGFQSGKFSCRENALALTKLQEAMLWLHKRSTDRIKRGVEGKRKA